MNVVCMHCGRHVPAVDAFRRVVGWERKSLDPTRKGGSDIALRNQLPEFACPTCIDRLRSGLNVGQEALL